MRSHRRRHHGSRRVRTPRVPPRAAARGSARGSARVSAWRRERCPSRNRRALADDLPRPSILLDRASAISIAFVICRELEPRRYGPLAIASTSIPDGTRTPSLPTDAISYSDLYARWERGNWRATELDFTEDARQWREEFTEFERQAALWNYCLFFWGEDAVADNLSPYIDAAPLEEQKYFLTTQQVDEARHSVFFKRFMQEVCGVGDGSVAGGLQAIKPQLTVGFRKIFDRLDTMADELRKDRSRPKLAAAVTLYHVVIEASLAQPGQHFICGYLQERDKLPAFREGMENIAADEQRHIGFGVKLLADLSREDPVGVPKAVAELLR